MSNWKKYVFVALICLLVLGLMLYGDIGRTGGPGGGGSDGEYGSASVNNRVDGTVQNLGGAQVAETVRMFGICNVPPIGNPQLDHPNKKPLPEEMIATNEYFLQAYDEDRYPAAPKEVDDEVDQRVWGDRVNLVDPKNPDRDALRQKWATDQQTTVKAIYDFMGRVIAAEDKQEELRAALTPNRSELALAYKTSHEKARVRYMEFPAAKYLDAAKLKVAGDTAAIKALYDKDKNNQRSPEGEIGDSMSRSLKLQFDMFYLKQDDLLPAVLKTISTDQADAIYKKEKADFEAKQGTSVLTKSQAAATFKDFKYKGKPVPIDPAWKDLKPDDFLPPEDWVMEYIKEKELAPVKIAAKAKATIRSFTAKYNAALLAEKPEDRGNLAPGFLAQIKQEDPKGWEDGFQYIHYLRTALTDFKAYAQAKHEQISEKTTTPFYLSTFFDQVANRGMLQDLESKLSDPLPYQVTYADGKELVVPADGGVIAFQIHAVENLNPAAAVMKMDDPEAKAILIERLAVQEAPKLAEDAATKTIDAWKKDPTQIPSDPKVLKEYTHQEGPHSAEEPQLTDDEKRCERIVSSITAGPKTADLTGQQAAPGVLVGPFDASLIEPPTDLLPAADKDTAGEPGMRQCAVIGFVVQYHEIADPAKRLAEDANWRTTSEAVQELPYLDQYLEFQMVRQSVIDSFPVTMYKPKPAAQ
ncbi:MAG: hypothetical protein ACREJ2_16890 [Planctomycetota bacterium]